jgi:UDP-3-O-acyl-N-acetylglucosamine deacetylase
MEKQSTINTSVSISGKGCTAENKLPLNLYPPLKIPASSSNGLTSLKSRLFTPMYSMCTYDTSRGTSIQEHNAEVKTVEHLLAALPVLN